MVSGNEFPRTEIEGVSLPRMLIGINWFMGYCHQTKARGKFNNDYMTPSRIADVIETFVREANIDCVYGILDEWPKLMDAVREAEQRIGRKIITIAVPHLKAGPTQEDFDASRRVIERQAAIGATFCLPHQATTDACLDRTIRKHRWMDEYCKMIRECGMIPGLSTHMPESIIFADEQNLDVATYIQIYNSAGFLMQVETDWIQRVIWNAKKPVMCIKPMAAGRIQPLEGLSFVWSTIRPRDMMVVGTMSPDEARELIEISWSIFENRSSGTDLQHTRSKASITAKVPAGK
jgi:hypothetical protein